jgi:hypothetical protein
MPPKKQVAKGKGVKGAADDEDWDSILDAEIKANEVNKPPPAPEAVAAAENEDDDDDDEEDDAAGAGNKVSRADESIFALISNLSYFNIATL